MVEYTKKEAEPALGTKPADLPYKVTESLKTVDAGPQKATACPEEQVPWPTAETVNRRDTGKAY